MKWYIALRKWTWELPQSFIGLCLLPFYNKHKLKKIEYKEQKVYIYDNFPGGISLGYYSLVNYYRKDWNKERSKIRLCNSIKHEHGHSIQSKWFGPLYFIIIGIPSVINNLICRYKRNHHIEYDYYKFYTEKSADKLGNVKR